MQCIIKISVLEICLSRVSRLIIYKLNMRNGKNDKHITLKEAAEISGYSPDYLGQLIRSGKLKGEQVFSNVAWMTTEKEILSYVKQKNGSRSAKPKISIFDQIIKRILAWDWDKIYTRILYVVIATMVLFIIFLFFIFSVNFEKRLEMKAEKENLLNVDNMITQ